MTQDEDYRPAWIQAMKEREELRLRVQELEAEVHASAEPWRVQNALLDAATKDRDRYKKALKDIRCKLSVTRVPSQKWVKTLHGELFCLAHFELEPE